MPPRDDLYLPGSPYHTARRKYASAAVRCLSVAMARLGRPASLLDVGCGEGALVQWCRRDGLDALGVDLAVPDPSPEWLIPWDLRVPLAQSPLCGRLFEWVICWEVAEHLPVESAETLCDSLTRHLVCPRGRLLFTAAQPGQRGPGHINCLPPETWRFLLMERGLTWLERETAELMAGWRKAAPQAPWYANNISVMAWA